MHELVDVATIFGQCLEALEGAKYKSVLAILDCMRTLITLTDDDCRPLVSQKLIEQSVDVVTIIIEEASNTPTWYFLYFEAFIDYFFQPALFLRVDLAGDCDSLAANVISYILQTAGSRKNIISRLARNLRQIWSAPEGRESRKALQPLIPTLLSYGPSREETEDKLAHSLTHANNINQEGEALALGSDYLVRVNINSILLHLERDNAVDHSFALAVLDDILSETSGQ